MSRPQTLTLRLAGGPLPPGGRDTLTLAQCGGSIGRSEDSDWVLSAPGISRTHAVVRYLNGMFFIEDRSTNGMLHNGAPMTRGEPAALGDGDRLQMDAFEIAVALQQASSPQSPDVPAPAGEEEDRTTMAHAAPGPAYARGDVAARVDDLLSSHARPPDDLLADIGLEAGGTLDPLDLLGPPASPGPAVHEVAVDWNHTPATADHFRPPQAAPDAGPQLPEEWDLTEGDFSAPAPPAPVSDVPVAPAEPAAVLPPAPPPAQRRQGVAGQPTSAPAALQGAQPLPPELEEIFSIVVDGVMDVLRARAEIKNTFRLPVTIIQRSENNPLKFAATPSEAIDKIMTPGNAAFLSGADAFEDAFDDIRCHQMAMLSGMRAAFESLLFHFNPDRLEQELDSSGKRSPFSGKGRYWARYRDSFASTVKDPDESFRRLFGDEFARAYEAQLCRLKSARKGQRR